jgi:hypothetical protein
MKNPWLKISVKPPYILKEDIDTINKFNDKVKLDYRISDYSGPVCQRNILAIK